MLFSQTCLTADRTDFSSALRNASTSTRSRGFGLLVLVFTLSPQWCRGAGVPRGRMSVGWSTRLEIPARDDAEREGPLDELRALLVLREVLDVELLEEAAQVGLDGIDAEEDLSGDLQVGGRGRVGRLLLVRPAQRRQDLPLGGGQRRHRHELVLHRGQLRGLAPHDPEAERRLTEDERVTVAQRTPAGDALAVEEGPVARQPVVHHGPALAHTVELGVEA